MSLYNFIDEHLLLPVGDLVYGSCIHRKLKEFRNNDKLTREEILEIQNEKIRRLVHHCYENVPYYRGVFTSMGIKPDDIRSGEDLCKLPILTKQIIRDHYSELFATNTNAKRIIKSFLWNILRQKLKMQTILPM